MEEENIMKNELFLTIRIFFIGLFVFLSICAISCAWYYMSVDESAYWEEFYQENYQDLSWKFFELEASYCKNKDNQFYKKYCE